MNKFDKIIWRINGILILCVALFAGFTVIFASYDMFRGKSKQRDANKIVNVNEETKKEEYLYLGSFSRIRGRDLFICPLYAKQKYNRSYYSKSTPATRNYLFFNQSDASSFWLFDSNYWLITEKHDIYKNFEKEQENTTHCFFFVVVKKDSNGDGLLNYGDNKSIYRINFDGSNLTVVIEETSKILGIKQIDEISSVIFHRKGKKNQAVIVDNSTGNIVKKSDLPLQAKQSKQKNKLE